MHSVQPMHRLSSITATVNGRSKPFAGLSGSAARSQQLRERFDAGRTARRTLIDLGFAGGDRFSVWTATFVAALRALRLRQQGVDSIRQTTPRLAL